MKTGHSGSSEVLSTIDRDERWVIKPWSKQGRVSMEIVGGAGSYFWDSDGRRYLDFESQLVNLNLGHQHPRLVAAVKSQAEQMCYVGTSMASKPRADLAESLAKLTPGDLNMSYFTTGGATANEAAIRFARNVTGRSKIVSRYRSYHGGTQATLTLTGERRRWAAEPGPPGAIRILDPYTYRCPAGHPDPCPVCAGAPYIEEILKYEDPYSVAAIVLETVTGTNGVIVPPDGYLESIRELCDRYGILLILDEVMVGFGRTGKWFAADHWNVVPDLMCVAKGINSGYVPLGALLISEKYRPWLRENTFTSGMTYSGHPLACAVANESIAIMKDEKIVERTAELGVLFGAKLGELQDKHPSIGEVRGLGLFWGLELVRDRQTREPLVPLNGSAKENAPMNAIVAEALRQGLYISGHQNVIRLAPPLVISEQELLEGVDILDRVLDVADSYVTA